MRKFWLAVSLIWILAVVLRILSMGDFADGTAGGHGPEYLIQTPDAGYHGYQAQAFLGQTEPRGPITLVAVLPALLSLVLPFSLDEIMFFLPAFLAPLLIFPLAWFARRLTSDLPALLISLIAAFAAGFYQRSHLGYYDTDLLNVFFPLLAGVFLVKLVNQFRLRSLILLIGTVLLYSWWYGSALSILLLFFGCFLFHILLFDRKNSKLWQALILLGLASLPLPWLLRLGLVGLGFALFCFALPRLAKTLPGASRVLNLSLGWLVPLLIGGVLVFASGGLRQVESRLSFYLGQSPQSELQTSSGVLNFVTAGDKISESKAPPTGLYLKTFAGHRTLGWLSLLALLPLVFIRREAIFLLPLAGLGLLGFFSGIRFAIYLAPLAILAFGWGIHYLVSVLLKREPSLVGLLVSILLLIPLWFNAKEVSRWNKEAVQPVLNSAQVGALIDHNQGPGDWAFSWWDYGWPLWHYGHWRTLIDNGIHGEADSYLVSRALLATNQSELAGLSRLMVAVKAESPDQMAILSLLARYQDLPSLITVAHTARTNRALPSPLIVLPWKLRYKFFTIARYSDFDPVTGQALVDRPTWVLLRRGASEQGRVNYHQTPAPRVTRKPVYCRLNLASGVLEIPGGGTARLSRLVRVSREAGRPELDERVYPGEQDLVLVEDQEGAILMHERFFRSNYVQLAILGRIDPELFDLSHGDPNLTLLRPRS